jgi:hypothetical protein
MKAQLICILVLSLYINLGLTDDTTDTPSTAQPQVDSKPYGPYYCQARCLASCLETYLAPTLDECTKFCPPFDENLPCPTDDTECWRTCGVPASAINQPAPDATVFVEIITEEKDQQPEPDPFTIGLAWEAVPNASVYIIEFYPLNRQPKPGETNFFRAITTSLAYTVRKEDECIQYDARVIAVNSYGISVPAYTHVEASTLSMTPGQHFKVRAMQRDPWQLDMVTVTIDYTFPAGWPVADIDLDVLRVTAKDCIGSMGGRTFSQITNPSNALNPAYNAVIGKTPTTAIQLSFFDDVLQSNCNFQMRISSISTRCNITTTFPEDPSLAPGVDFRINCDTMPGACDNSTDDTPPPPMAPIPVPLDFAIDPDVIVPPINLPAGINQPDEQANNTEEIPAIDLDNMPTPPPLPLFIIGDLPVVPPQAQPMPPGFVPPGSSISIIEISPNGSNVGGMQIVPQLVAPPLCEQDMFDVEPSLSELSPSLIDLTITWLERQPLPPPPPPTYFTIRYGPLVRLLVDDDREQSEIVPGFETIVRTGQQSLDGPAFPDPTREINVSGLQRNSLLKVQICAIYDPNSEPFIQWDTIPSHRVDLAALEPFLELEDAQTETPSISSEEIIDATNEAIALANANTIDSSIPVQTTQTDEDQVEVPLIITVSLDNQNASSSLYWITVMAGLMLMMLTAVFVFVCLRRMCFGRRRMVNVVEKEPKSFVFVTTPQMPPPTFNEVVKGHEVV